MSYLNQARSLGELICLSCEVWSHRIAAHYHEGPAFRSITYKELYQRIFEIAGKLYGLGLKKEDRLAIIAENSLEWALVDWAAQTLGVILVPIYPTLPKEQVQYILKDSNARVLIAGTEQLADKTTGYSNLQVLLLNSGDGYSSLESLLTPEDFKKEQWRKDVEQIQPGDVATYIYTSGTTGFPKGTMLSHQAFLHITKTLPLMQIVTSSGSQFPIDENDVFLSFLPLSHVYERVAGHVLPYAIGASVGYVRSVATFAKDMIAVRPTVMLSVPRIIESMRDRILDQIAKQSHFRRRVFALALNQGKKRASGQFAPFFWLTDNLVGKQIRSKTGGRLKYLISGGAALPEYVGVFFQAFDLQIYEGYGLTETCAVTTCNFPGKRKFGTVGVPIDGVNIKIDQDGEILVKGPTVMLGYYALPDATAEAIDQDGWFHTGDVGKLEEGFLRITDRKKDLIVLGNGKNVAPQPIENLLRGSVWIEEAVLFGDGMEHICALIVPNLEKLSSFGSEKGFDNLSLDVLVQKQEIRALYKTEIEKVNKNLASFEKIKKFELLSKRFSIEEGEITPSYKVRRKVIKEKYAQLIQSLQRPKERP